MRCLWALMLWGGWLLFVEGCADPAPPRQELVRSLRILAIRAEPPAARPGDTLTLTALVANPAQRPLRWRWYACKSPNQANSGCASRDDAIALGQTPEVRYTIPKDFLPSNASLVDQFRGIYLPITLVVETEQKREEALKRVVVSSLPTNQNPTLTSLEQVAQDNPSPQTEPWSFRPGVAYQWRPRFASDAIQDMFTLSPNGSIQVVKETLFVAWYITAGALRRSRQTQGEKAEQIWVAPAADQAPAQIHLYVVLRDGRGGVHWLTRTLQRSSP